MLWISSIFRSVLSLSWKNTAWDIEQSVVSKKIRVLLIYFRSINILFAHYEINSCWQLRISDSDLAYVMQDDFCCKRYTGSILKLPIVEKYEVLDKKQMILYVTTKALFINRLIYIKTLQNAKIISILRRIKI